MDDKDFEEIFSKQKEEKFCKDCKHYGAYYCNRDIKTHLTKDYVTGEEFKSQKGLPLWCPTERDAGLIETTLTLLFEQRIPCGKSGRSWEAKDA